MYTVNSVKIPIIALVFLRAIIKQNCTINYAYPADLSKVLSVADWLCWTGKGSFLPCTKAYSGEAALLWIPIVMVIDASIVHLHYCD